MKPMDSVSYEELELNKAFGSGYKTYFEVNGSFGGTINEIEVENETEKFITIVGRRGRWAKIGQYTSYFKTREEAKQHLITKIKKEIDKLEKDLTSARDTMNKYEQL